MYCSSLRSAAAAQAGLSNAPRQGRMLGTLRAPALAYSAPAHSWEQIIAIELQMDVLH